jgi:Ca-activated chloride channel family protein
MTIDDPRLTAYAVDEADEQTKAAVEADGALQDEADEIRDMAGRLEDALAREESPALLPEQREAIHARAARGRAPVMARWAAGLAALLALAVGLTQLRQRSVVPSNVTWMSVGTPVPPGPATSPAPIDAPKASEGPRGRAQERIANELPPPPPAAAPSTGPVPFAFSEDQKLRLSPYAAEYGQAQAPQKDANWRAAEEAARAQAEAYARSMAAGRVVEKQKDTFVALRSVNNPGAAGAANGFEMGGKDVRSPSAPPNREAYAYRADNDFLAVDQNPLSTFSIDVDTASYSNVRRFITEGQLPPPDAVRIEEMVNYFPYDDPAPTGDDRFAAQVEVGPAPWRKGHRLVRIALKTRELEKRPDSNLVFLIDVSGSMMPANKLPLVKQALRLLVDKLTEHDRVAIVVYAGSAGEVLPPTRGDKRQVIQDAIERLEAGGSTNGGEGIQLAYDLAARNLIRGGVNRVILATDGDFNVGTTDEGSLVRLIEERAKSGVFLSVFGFGMGNYQDSRLEQLADKGNGNYGYIDTLHEARKTFVEQTNATLVTVAKDVKIQVEFNPAKVQSYRLLGYENRLLRPEDFKDDKKDAGEVGAGHSVTALYELIPAGSDSQTMPARDVDPLAYQKKGGLTDAAKSRELLRLKIRYKEPEGDVSRPQEWPIEDRGAMTTDENSDDFRFAAAVAELGMILRGSPHKGEASLDDVLRLAESGRGNDRFGYRAEFISLVHKARGLMAEK